MSNVHWMTTSMLYLILVLNKCNSINYPRWLNPKDAAMHTTISTNKIQKYLEKYLMNKTVFKNMSLPDVQLMIPNYNVHLKSLNVSEFVLGDIQVILNNAFKIRSNNS